MKIAFLAVCTPGHLYPTTTRARKLKGRGHDVVLIAVPEAEPIADAAGIPFLPCCEEEYPVGSIAAMLDELSRLQAREAFEYSLRKITRLSVALFENLPRTLAEARSGDRHLLGPLEPWGRSPRQSR
jgi:UDP:flavonoid glycosyltransferase YjiC (YdhE family)